MTKLPSCATEAAVWGRAVAGRDTIPAAVLGRAEGGRFAMVEDQADWGRELGLDMRARGVVVVTVQELEANSKRKLV